MKPLRDITPLMVSSYLATMGWKWEREDNLFQVWYSYCGNIKQNIFIPLHPEWKDYSSRLKETLKQISIVEWRSEASIMEDIISFWYN